MWKQVLWVAAFAIATFFGSLELLRYSASAPVPAFLRHSETLVLALAYQHFVLAVILGLGFGAPLGYVLKGNVVRGSLIAILPVPIIYALAGPWPQNKWVNILGYSFIVIAYCGFAYMAHYLTTRPSNRHRFATNACRYRIK